MTLVQIKDKPDIKLETSKLRDKKFYKEACVVIDNGTSSCRAGYSNEKNPCLVFEPTVHKIASKGENHSFIVGELPSGTSKINTKTPFDQGIVTHLHSMETILDHIFTNLKLTEAKPVIMTEPVCNLPLARKDLTELMFECYQVPKLFYGIDSIFSLYQNNLSSTSLIVSCSNLATHVLPLVNGKLQFPKRLNYGGEQASELMLKLMQCKYPSFPTRMTLDQAKSLLHDHSYIPLNYKEELKKFIDQTEFKKLNVQVQFPFIDEKSDQSVQEAEAKERLALKRKELGNRLKEQAAIKRVEKLKLKQEKFAKLKDLLDQKSNFETEQDFVEYLQDNEFENQTVLLKEIKTLQDQMAKSTGVEPEKEKQNFDLIDVPDSSLSQADIKEKRRQKLVKASADHRQLQKIEKEKELEKEKLIQAEQEERRLKDPQKFVQDLKSTRTEILEKIKNREKLKLELANRKSHASFLKMKALGILTSDFDLPTRKRKQDQAEITEEEDLKLLEQISEIEDSEVEENDQLELLSIEEKLIKFDPTFIPLKPEQETFSIINQLTFGNGIYQEDRSISEKNQLNLNVERIKVPQVIFEPFIIGNEQAGLTEIIESILKNFVQQTQAQLANNVFLTGGMVNIPGFQERILVDLRMMRPLDESINVIKALDPCLDAWRGAAKWANNQECEWITRADYEEKGAEYLHRSMFSNLS